MPEGLRPLDSLPVDSSGVERIRHWLRTVLGLDRAVGFTVLARFWSSAAGLVTIFLIARFLSLAEQGYYYTFGSLVAIQMIFELGFSYVILQMASHERAQLSISADYEITGDPVAHARLASVIQKSVRWYSVAAVLLAATLVPVGFHFFSTHQHPGVAVSWRFPWCLAAIMAAFNFQVDPLLSFLEGCGYVPDVARLRFMQSATGSLLAWGALATHHGLFAPSMMLLGMASSAVVWLVGKRKLLLGLLRYHPGSHRIRWIQEVWPFQWRIAVSWFCGYFIYWLFNPVLFAYRGPVEAGQMGMTLSMVNAIQNIAVSWVSTKSAPFGTFVARKEYGILDHTFFRALRQTFAVSVAGALTAWMGCIYLNWLHLRFAQRLLDPTSLGLLLVYMVINVIIFAEAFYLRAHKQEVFLANSVVGAVIVTITTLTFGRYYGARGIAVTGCIGNFFGLAWATYKFRKYRKLWHTPEGAPETGG
jgi:hypothetical protein